MRGPSEQTCRSLAMCRCPVGVVLGTRFLFTISICLIFFTPTSHNTTAHLPSDLNLCSARGLPAPPTADTQSRAWGGEKETCEVGVTRVVHFTSARAPCGLFAGGRAIFVIFLLFVSFSYKQVLGFLAVWYLARAYNTQRTIEARWKLGGPVSFRRCPMSGRIIFSRV